MKTYNNLFDKLCSLENLRLAFKKARKGKAKKWYVKEFEVNLEGELTKLKVELETQSYKPRPLKRFVIRDPKTRVIYASAFRDRVVHHALCNLIEPIFERTFICDTYANRRKKGVHAALERFDEFKRKVTKNGKLVESAKDNNMVVGYALKADIKHYFDTVDHEILLDILKKKITDGKVLRLVEITLRNHKMKFKGKGMPLGNLTSQFFANVYLSKLDYFVKHRLKAKYYMRYVDDFVILHRSKEKLGLYRWLISNFLKSLKLELHPEKSRIIPLHNGVKLLGFRVFYHHRLLRESNLRNFERKLNFYELSSEREREGNKESLEKFLQGWFGYAVHGNTYKFRKKILENANFEI